ncbi:MAG: hypothetical protein BV458_11910 [Thermoplasmata archaeon M9B2D]|nr:MAG: hypothetical protein BV458_11910 [Thermoplasmata archaeon M9B2D]
MLPLFLLLLDSWRKGTEARGKKNEQTKAFLYVSLLLTSGIRRKRLVGRQYKWNGIAFPPFPINSKLYCIFKTFSYFL